jgi:drug/metabolite transporter (DMT)-like permease
VSGVLGWLFIGLTGDALVVYGGVHRSWPWFAAGLGLALLSVLVLTPPRRAPHPFGGVSGLDRMRARRESAEQNGHGKIRLYKAGRGWDE